MGRKDQYVVGYKGSQNVVYGKRHFMITRSGRFDINDFAHPMTQWQAERALEEMPCAGACIFKLVPVDTDPSDDTSE